MIFQKRFSLLSRSFSVFRSFKNFAAYFKKEVRNKVIRNKFSFAQGMKYSTSLCTKETFEKTINSPEVASIIDKIVEAEKAWRPDMTQDELRQLKQAIKPLKEQLPVIMPHAYFTDGHRHGQSAVQSAFCSADFDGLEAPIVTWYEKFRPVLPELRVALAYVSPSGHGLKVIFVRVDGMTNEQNQLWISKMTGIQNYDSTADLARAAFLTKSSNLLCYDPELLFADEVELTPMCEKYKEMIGMGNGDGDENKNGNENGDGNENGNENEKGDGNENEKGGGGGSVATPSYKNIKLTDIRDALLTRWGIGVEGPKVGERNNIVFKLAQELASLDSSLAVLKAVIPQYTMEEKEWNDTLTQAIKYCSHGKPSRELSQIIDDLTIEEEEEDDQLFVIDSQKEVKIPSKIPEFFKVVLRKYPKYQHPSILAASLPVCATLATRARIQGNDNTINALSAQACVVGEWGSGKDCISLLYDDLMYKIKEEDDANRAIEQEWVENRECAAEDTQKPRRPHNPIRMLTPSTTKIKMLERMKDANGKHCILMTTEIDELSNNTSLSYSKIEPIMRLAFDKDGGYVGNDSCSTQSANMNIKARLNVLLAGTDDAVHRFFKSPEGGGPSRVLFSIMPNRYGMEKPKYKDYTPEEEAIIHQGVERLMAEDDEEHPYHLPAVEKALNKWQKRFRSEYVNKQVDVAKLKLTYRAYEIALRAGCVAYILNGKVEDDSVVAFARYIANLTVYGGYTLFADKMNAASANAKQHAKNMRAYATPVKDLLNALPEYFTKEQLINLRREQGVENPTEVRYIVSRWRTSNYIENIEGAKNKYHKLKNA